MKNSLWLIIGIIATGALSGCSTSIAKRQLPVLPVAEKTVQKADKPKADVAKNEIIKGETVKSTKPEKNDLNDAGDLDPMPTGKRLPTLREQMQKIADEQAAITTRHNELMEDVVMVRQDVAQMKESLEDIKTALAEMRGKKTETFSKGGASETPAEKPVRVLKSTIVNGDILPDDVVRETIEKKDDDDGVIQPDNVQPKKPAVKQIAAKEVPAKNSFTKPQDATQRPKPEPKVSAKAQPKKDAGIFEKPMNEPIFQTAMSLFKKRNFAETITLLEGLLKTEKNLATQCNCNYWLGESYYGLGQYSQAISYFKKVSTFKNSEKSDDAQRMIAEAFAKGGNIAEARRAFQRLIETNPDSEFVPLARKRLQML